jgi:hypothetical protein
MGHHFEVVVVDSVHFIRLFERVLNCLDLDCLDLEVDL